MKGQLNFLDELIILTTLQVAVVLPAELNSQQGDLLT